MPSEYVDYPYKLDLSEPVISNTSHNKFRADVTNNVNYNWAENNLVSIVDIPENTTIEAVFANGYMRDQDIDPEESIVSVNFERLQAHPNYTIGFRYHGIDNIPHTMKINHVSILEQTPVVIPFDMSLDIGPGESYTIDDNDACYTSITIRNGGTLFVDASNVFTEQLVLYNGSELNMQDNSDLDAYKCECINEETFLDAAVINTEGDGDLDIESVMIFGSDQETNPACCELYGNNQNNMTIYRLYMGEDDRFEILETNNPTGSEASLLVSKADDMNGDISIESNMAITNNVNLADGGSISVQAGGKLFLIPEDDNLDFTASITLEGANSYFMVQDDASLIVRSRASLSAYDSSAIANIQGTLILEDFAEFTHYSGVLYMQQNTNIELSGRSMLHVTNNGVLKLGNGVTITGATAKNDAVNLPGDRIVIDEGGDLKSDNAISSNHICNITVHSSDEQWEGIAYDSPTHWMKLFIDWDVSDVDKLLFTGNSNPSAKIKFLNCHISDCTYGIRAQEITEVFLDATRIEGCEYGLFASGIVDVTLTVFQGNTDNAVFDGNVYGVVIKDADNGGGTYGCPEIINAYDFINNTEAAITYTNSFINITGVDNENMSLFQNNKIGIDGSIANPSYVSLIEYCRFTGNTSDALYLSDQCIRIDNNKIYENGRNGLWGYQGSMQELSSNHIYDNGGAEIIGCRDFLEGMKDGNNTVSDDAYVSIFHSDPPDYWDASVMDQYILVKTDLIMTRSADVSGNDFPNITDPGFEDRLYPSYFAFNFEEGQINGVEELYASGISDFESENYTSAKYTLTLLVTDYPESKEAISALIYFLYITAKTDQDYETLRQELNALVSEDYPDLYKEKEYVITQSYLYEKNYTEVIERLEETIESPDTKMDSVVAVATEGYCYVQLAESGDRALPQQCTVRTKTFEEYLEYMRNLRMVLDSGAKTQEAPAFKFSLDANYPNPFNPTTTISFSIPKDDKVELKVYNIKGQLVKTLVNDHLEAGMHKAVWNGDNQLGKSVSSGIYLYRLESCGKSKAQKMLLLK